MKNFDLIIIGAGPAGMLAAYTIIEKSKILGIELKILMIDKGKEVEKRECTLKTIKKCIGCKPCNIMCGIGGAGIYSDGLLNLRPDIGGNLMDFVDEKEAWELINKVDEIFVKFGCPKEQYLYNKEDAENLKRKAASVGVKFVEIPQKFMGSDGAIKVIKNFVDYLKNNGVEILSETEVLDIIVKENKCEGVIINEKNEKGKGVQKIFSKITLLCPGRIGVTWISEIIKKHKIDAKYSSIDIGVRVEVPSIIMDEIIKVNRDPKFHIWTTKYGDFVRTFCTNHQGFVVKENYGKFIGVNGHSLLNKKTENTNFAFLVHINLTEPLENTTLYGESIAQIATILGGGKPLVQRLGDLRRGRRSTFERLKRSIITPTLTEVAPSNLAMALPHRILEDILEGLEKLNEIIPGVASDSILLYAPEIKFYAMKIITKGKTMETKSIENLFVAGDGAGLSRGIVNAAATGILSAEGIIEKLKIMLKN